jgi:hypothetical protein
MKNVMDMGALSPFPFENIYHIGVVCPDIVRGMEEVGEQLGITWAPRRTANVTVWSPDGSVKPIGLEVVYSRNGPPYLELIEATSDETVWSGAPGPRLHHIGVYVDDLQGEVARLTAAGMVDEAHGVGPDGNLSLFSYLMGAHGMRVELVDASGREGTLSWVNA